jgi:hypothetical protein
VSVRKAKRAHYLFFEHRRGGGGCPLAVLVDEYDGCIVASVTHDEGLKRSKQQQASCRMYI